MSERERGQMEMKSKVLITGGTGYLGKRLVKASLGQGHETYVLYRPEIGVDIEKVQMLLSFKKQGAHLVQGSFNDRQSLVNAVRLVDVVICAISGVHIRSHQILLQLKLVDAIKEAGNVKVLCPPSLAPTLQKWRTLWNLDGLHLTIKWWLGKRSKKLEFLLHMFLQTALLDTFSEALCQPGHIIPSREHVSILGSGEEKAIYVDEDDIATYTIMAVDDPRTLNKTLYIMPPRNILSQRDVVQIWEKLIGKELRKSSISSEEFLASMREQDYAEQVGLTHYYHVCFEGCLTKI
ncbi:hypothetical protein OIU84_022479 [Salix udensis]|uniref:(+)-lariciresinol reductase n=1 Tax=Salix udensis TaxID=889485 RepID=A0AAD6PFA3_9ROSI|nr:hypothetical protein OIU84_022479 [Salix udensis]